MSDEQDYTVSSDNLYADFGYPEPQIALAKAELARRLIAIIRERGLTQAAAGDILGVGQPKVSAIMRGRLKDFSLERLMEFLTLFNHDVEIAVAATPNERRAPGRILVHDDRSPGQTPMAASSRGRKHDGARFD
jgi:predicted XRE-type DNA-binding protein